ncbi:MAG TPA: class I SAM-dependent methyltransferase [Pseudomonadales bacterium]
MTDKKNIALSETRFGVKILSSRHPDIRKLKKQHPTSIHGNKPWKSSFLLMDYFRRNPLPAGSRVMEIGCGWGPAGIYLNRYHDCQVTAIDADPDVFPFLQLHADINKASITSCTRRFEDIRKRDLADIDVLIAADVCFWDELTDTHRKLIKRAINAGVSKIVYADPMRSPFLSLADICAETYHAECTELELKRFKARGALMVIENA